MKKKQLEEMAKVILHAANGGEVEYIISNVSHDDEWTICKEPDWDYSYYNFRIKKVPRTCWRNEYLDGRICGGYSTKDKAKGGAGSNAKQIKFVEVIEDE